MTDINTQRALKKIYRLATAFITGALPVTQVSSTGVAQTMTGTAADVATSSDSVNAYGPKVEFLKYPFNSGATTLAAALSLTNISSYHKGVFTISGLTTETIAVTGDFETGASDSIVVRKASDGALANAATLGNGTYYFTPECQLIFDNVDFVKSAGVDSVTIKGHLMP